MSNSPTPNLNLIKVPDNEIITIKNNIKYIYIYTINLNNLNINNLVIIFINNIAII